MSTSRDRVPLTVLFSSAGKDWPIYAPLLRLAFESTGIDASLVNRAEHPGQVDYIVGTADGPVSDFTPFTGAKAVLSLWAGVEQFVANPTLTQPLGRMVDPEGLTRGMVEWVTGHVLRHHLGMDRYIASQDGVWAPEIPPLAGERAVAMLGLGELGVASATALAALGFDVTGWSRSPKNIPGIACMSGAEGLEATLDGAEIVVLLLPQTPQTENILGRDALGHLAMGAVVINPGRGPLIDDDALLAALDSGQVGQATLDVFREEPLPPDHPFWAHPQVTVTPHVASATRPATAAMRIAEAIAAVEAGRALPGAVDRTAGY